MMVKAASLTKQRRAQFLQTLAEHGNVSLAARQAGVGRWLVYELRKAEPDFAREWENALRESEDRLEAEAVRRAVDGIEEPYFYQGEQRGASRKYSDQLLMFLLKSRRPERFGVGTGTPGDADGYDADAAAPAAAGPVVFELHLGGEPAAQEATPESGETSQTK